MPSFSSFTGTLTNPFSSPSTLQQSGALQDFFSQKQQGRVAIKILKEVEAGLVEAKVVASRQPDHHGSKPARCAKPVRALGGRDRGRHQHRSGSRSRRRPLPVVEFRGQLDPDDVLQDQRHFTTEESNHHPSTMHTAPFALDRSTH